MLIMSPLEIPLYMLIPLFFINNDIRTSISNIIYWVLRKFAHKS